MFAAGCPNLCFHFWSARSTMKTIDRQTLNPSPKSCSKGWSTCCPRPWILECWTWRRVRGPFWGRSCFGLFWPVCKWCTYSSSGNSGNPGAKWCIYVHNYLCRNLHNSLVWNAHLAIWKALLTLHSEWICGVCTQNIVIKFIHTYF